MKGEPHRAAEYISRVVCKRVDEFSHENYTEREDGREEANQLYPQGVIILFISLGCLWQVVNLGRETIMNGAKRRSPDTRV